METVFDFQPTDAELDDLLSAVKDRKQHCERLSEDSNLALIAKLLSLRGQDTAADAYVEKIENPEYRLSLTLLLHEFVQ